MYNFNKPKTSKMNSMPMKKAPMAKKPGSPQSAKSILAMIRKLPNKMVQQIYKGLESLEPDDLDMLGKKKYPGE